MSISHCKTYDYATSKCTACYDNLKPTADGQICECVASSGADCGAGKICTKTSQCVGIDSCFAIPMCTACDFNDQSKCYKCYSGYFPSKDGSKCISIQPCSSIVNCTKCSEVVGQESQCATCAGNLTLNDGKCNCDGTDCKANESCTKSKDATAGKKICIANNTCLDKASASYVENCASCNFDDHRKCYSCEIGYELDSNGACVSIGACADILDCISCESVDKTKCDKCYNYTYPAADGSACECVVGSKQECDIGETCSASLRKCVANSACAMEGPYYIEHCVECQNNDHTKCFACAPGYYRAADYKSCVYATCQNIKFCSACDATNIKKCSKCAGNLKPTADGNACECVAGSGTICPEGTICNATNYCIAVGTCANIANCTECKYLEQDKCHKCVNSNAVEYFPSADGTKCLEYHCEEIAKCATCYEDDLSKCASCQSEHVLNKEKGVCECTIGSGEVCGTGMYCSRSNNKCVPAGACTKTEGYKIDKCSKCQGGDDALCEACVAGYYPSADGKICLSLDTCASIANCVACDTTNLKRCAKCANYLSPGVFGMTCECEPGTQTGCAAGEMCSYYLRQCKPASTCVEEIKHCAECYNGSPELCYKCEAGYKYNFARTKCIPNDACITGNDRIQGCTKCVTQDPRKCVVCEKGMVPTPFGDRCVCGDTDTTCINNETCVLYGIEKRCMVMAKCHESVVNCFACDGENSKVCVYCNSGFQWDAQANKCVRLTCSIEHCTTCDGEKCAACNDRLMPSADGLTCVCGTTGSACPSGYQCSNAGVCEKTGACKETDIYCTYCQLGEQTQCARCIDGFELLRGKCVMLGECKAVDHCIQCDETNPSKCAACNYGLMPDEATNTCLCGVPGKTCASTEKCMEGVCTDIEKCLKDDRHCSSCDHYDPSICAQCEWGFSPNFAGVCEVGANCFGIKNCKKCDFDNAKLCYSCGSNLSVTDDQLTCECVPGSKTGCPDGEVCTSEQTCVKKFACQDIHFCTACVYDDESKCYSCAKGYYLNKEKTECLPLNTCAHVENCNKCNFNDPSKCYGCSNYLKYNSTTEKCECVANSGVGCAEGLVCSSGACVAKDACMTTDKNCKSCVFSAPNKCYACNNGFYPDSKGICVTNEPCQYIKDCDVCQFTQTHRCYSCANQLTPGPLALSCECVPGSRTGCATGQICVKYEGVCVMINQCTDKEHGIANCKSCVPENNLLCSECADGYKPSFDGKRCVPVDACKTEGKIEGCTECHSIFPVRCATCADGMSPNSFATKCLCGGELGTVCKSGQQCKDGKCVADNKKIGIIVGCTVGAVVVVAIIIAVVLILLKKRRAGNVKADVNTYYQPTAAGAGDGANLYI